MRSGSGLVALFVALSSLPSPVNASVAAQSDAQPIDDKASAWPVTGEYTNASGDRYDVRATAGVDFVGQSRMSDICVQFQERAPVDPDAGLKRMKMELGITQWLGRSCHSQTSGGGHWIATFSDKAPRKLILTSKNGKRRGQTALTIFNLELVAGTEHK